MNNYRITIEDMMCNNCVRKITDALQKASEKTAVSANLAKKYIEVETDLSVEDLFATIEDAGFTPTDLELI